MAAGLVTAACWGTADYLSRSQSERVGHYKTVVYSQLVTFVILVALLPVFGLGPEVSAFPVAVLLLAGAINFAAFILLYRAFHRGVITVVAPIAYTYPAFTTVLSVVILQTALSLFQIAAIAGVILGIVLLSTRFSELMAFASGNGAPGATAGVGSAMGASALFGTVYIGVGYAAPLVGIVLPALLLRAMGAGAGFVVAPLTHQDVRPSRLAISNTILTMAVLETAGFLSFTYGVIVGGESLPVLAALSGMGGAVAAFYGIALLKERLEWNQAVGGLLTLGAVFVLLYVGG